MIRDGIRDFAARGWRIDFLAIVRSFSVCPPATVFVQTARKVFIKFDPVSYRQPEQTWTTWERLG
jgi:hypothetical protein